MNSKAFHFGIITHWSILQNIMDRIVDIALSCRVLFETVYLIIYVLASASPLFFARNLGCDVVLNGLCVTISWSHYSHSSEWTDVISFSYLTQSVPSWDSYVMV